jgi:hypothetical protein
MSALRVSTPGQPTVLIDQGPSVARTHTRGYVYGGAFVSGHTPPPPARVRPVVPAAAKVKTGWVICGKPLPIAGGVCHARKGHLDSHRSRAAMDSAAERRRSGVGRW